MKIAIPMAEGALCMHFGHCEAFAFAEVDENKNIVKVELLTPPPHAPGVIPKWIAEQKADLVIAGGMGPMARNILNSMGVEVVTGAMPDTPENIVKAFLAGELVTGDNVCDHGHGGHEHGHSCHH